MDNRWLLVTDDGVQWFDYLVHIKEDSNSIEVVDRRSINRIDLREDDQHKSLRDLPLNRFKMSIDGHLAFYGHYITKRMYEHFQYVLDGDDHSVELGTD